MAVDILSPTYWINELFGSLIVFIVSLMFGVTYIAAKMKFNFQFTVILLFTAALMLPVIF